MFHGLLHPLPQMGNFTFERIIRSPEFQSLEDPLVGLIAEGLSLLPAFGCLLLYLLLYLL